MNVKLKTNPASLRSTTMLIFNNLNNSTLRGIGCSSTEPQALLRTIRWAGVMGKQGPCSTRFLQGLPTVLCLIRPMHCTYSGNRCSKTLRERHIPIDEEILPDTNLGSLVDFSGHDLCTKV